MQAGREPSMEDILASIKKVIADEKELRAGARPAAVAEEDSLPEDLAGVDDDVLELDEPLAPRSISVRRWSMKLSQARAARRSSSCRPSPRRFR